MLFLNESYVIADHVETLVYQIYCDFKMAKMASDNGRITTIVHVQCISVINKKKRLPQRAWLHCYTFNDLRHHS